MRRVLAVVSLSILVFQGSAGAADAECRWERVEAPEPGPVVRLVDVVAIDDSDAWAVGGFTDGGEFSLTRTLAIHWDGAEWTIVETPNRSGSLVHELAAVSGTAPDDVWAVGTSYQVPNQGRIGSRGPDEPLVLHWDGQSWQLIRALSTSADLTDVVARARDDVWVAGYRYSGRGIEKSVVFHFDGTMWRMVPTGNKAGQSRALFAVTATSEAIWFAGTRWWAEGRAHPYALRYRTGTRETWRMPPPTEAQYPIPTGIAATSETDVWAVGSYFVPNSSEIFARRFTGTRWRNATAPQVGSGGINDFKGLTALDAVGPDVWAAGYQTTDTDESPRSEAVIAQWDGSEWAVESFPEDGSGSLQGIDMSESANGWAVGTVQVDHSESEPSFAPPSDGLILRRECS